LPRPLPSIGDAPGQALRAHDVDAPVDNPAERSGRPAERPVRHGR
jgi:hypothetical protein